MKDAPWMACLRCIGVFAGCSKWLALSDSGSESASASASDSPYDSATPSPSDSAVDSTSESPMQSSSRACALISGNDFLLEMLSAFVFKKIVENTPLSLFWMFAQDVKRVVAHLTFHIHYSERLHQFVKCISFWLIFISCVS